MRIDDATKIFGLRFNALLSAVLCVVGVAMFIRYGRKPAPVTVAGPDAAGADAADSDVAGAGVAGDDVSGDDVARRDGAGE